MGFPLIGILSAAGAGGAPLEGGAVYTDDTYTYHAFTASDTLTVNLEQSYEWLLIAGGGGGGQGLETWSGSGGGGAGGLIQTSGTVATGDYTITIGAGGAVSSAGVNSVFPAVGTAIGGGLGAPNYSTNGGDGGSGGGGFGSQEGNSVGGTGTSGQGTNGGNPPGFFNSRGAGGGGAGEAGQATDSGSSGGNGLQYGSWGSAISIVYDAGYFAGGGGGGQAEATTDVAALGGGGQGSSRYVNSTAGSANSGGGGGAASDRAGVQKNASAGGSGLFVIRYTT